MLEKIQEAFKILDEIKDTGFVSLNHLNITPAEKRVHLGKEKFLELFQEYTRDEDLLTVKKNGVWYCCLDEEV